MRWHVLILVVLIGAFPGRLLGQAEISLTDSVGGAATIDIDAGDAFDVDVTIETQEAFFGFTYLLSISDSGSGLFTITARDIPAASPFSSLITSDPSVLKASNALLDPESGRDLGVGTPNFLTEEPAGVYHISTLTLSSDSAVASGVYTLSATVGSGDPVAAILGSGETVAMDAVSLTINVINGGSGNGGGGNGGGGNGGGGNGGGGDTTDTDEDGVPDEQDAFPEDPDESVDTDEDGTGDNADTDDDNDGVEDEMDEFPEDPTESSDHDGDGIGDNADTDDDNDGILDVNDPSPTDPPSNTGTTPRPFCGSGTPLAFIASFFCLTAVGTKRRRHNKAGVRART